MDRNENMLSGKHRDREKLLGELAKLENEEAACWSRILWNSLSLLIVEPAIVAGTAYISWTQIREALASGTAIFNGWVVIGFAVGFTLTSLILLYYIWKMSSLKKQTAKIKQQIYHLER